MLTGHQKQALLSSDPSQSDHQAPMGWCPVSLFLSEDSLASASCLFCLGGQEALKTFCLQCSWSRQLSFIDGCCFTRSGSEPELLPAQACVTCCVLIGCPDWAMTPQIRVRQHLHSQNFYQASVQPASTLFTSVTHNASLFVNRSVYTCIFISNVL